MKLFYILYRKRHEQIPLFLIQFVFFGSSDTNTRSCDVSLLEATCQVPKRVFLASSCHPTVNIGNNCLRRMPVCLSINSVTVVSFQQLIFSCGGLLYTGKFHIIEITFLQKIIPNLITFFLLQCFCLVATNKRALNRY